MRFELKHDKLAAQVYDLASTEAKARRKAESIYQMYEEIGTLRLFTEEELGYLGQFLPVLRPKDSLQRLIQESKKDLGRARREADERERARLEREKELIERSKMRQRRISWVIGVAGVIAVILLYLAFDQYQTAQENLRIAEENKQITEEIRQNLEGKNQLNNALKNQISANLQAMGQENPLAADAHVAELNQKLPSAFIDPRDWTVYETVELNGQIWMAENLNFALASESWYYDNDPKNGKKFGRLYTWDAANKACPAGWRLPTAKEWGDMSNLFGGTTAYLALIEGGNTNFSAQLGGIRYPSDAFDELGTHGYYWSNTEAHEGDASLFTFISEHKVFYQYDYAKSWGFSCRCIKDKLE